MPSFFVKPSNTSFKHALTLTQYQDKKVKFNPNDPAHIELLEDCTRSVQQTLKSLQAIDIKITIGFALGTTALGLSYLLPFLSLAAVAGFAYSAYQIGLRKHVYTEYTDALENLAKCCIWTLGEVSSKAVTENEAVKAMINTLAPVTSEQQLRDFIDDKVENQFIKQADHVKEELTFADYHLNQEQNRLYFKIYGYKQGNFLDILQGVGYAIKNGFNALKDAITNKTSTQHMQ